MARNRPLTRLARASGLRLARWHLRVGGRGSRQLQGRSGLKLGCRCRRTFWNRNSQLPCVLKRATEHRPENRDNTGGCCAYFGAPLPAFPSVAVSNTTTRGALVDGAPPFARVHPSRQGTPKKARGHPNLSTTVFSQWAATSSRIGPVRSQGDQRTAANTAPPPKEIGRVFFTHQTPPRPPYHPIAMDCLLMLTNTF